MNTLIPPTASTFFFFSFFFLSIFTSNLPSAAADVVTDRDGDALQNGGTYHILPCSEGLPVRISSPYGIAYINEGLILNLAFASSPSCAPTPSKWSVVKDLPEGEAVKLPEYPSTVSGWFKIVPSSLKYLYKVVFCASSGGTCGEVGISVDDEGMRRLVVTEDEGIMIREIDEGSGSYPVVAPREDDTEGEDDDQEKGGARGKQREGQDALTLVVKDPSSP
ncbi:hypothetical protein ACSQ67_016418 [Phaseolus vulgaris]